MRHHLNIIDSYLTNGNIQQATQYIHNVRKDIAALSPSHFCENETVNLLCSSFSKKAEKMNVKIHMWVKSLCKTVLLSPQKTDMVMAVRALKPLSGNIKVFAHSKQKTVFLPCALFFQQIIRKHLHNLCYTSDKEFLYSRR